MTTTVLNHQKTDWRVPWSSRARTKRAHRDDVVRWKEKRVKLMKGKEGGIV